MESYADMLKRAEKAGSTVNITPEYHEWGDVGDTIVGTFVSKAAVTSGLGGKDYFQYLFDTDSGKVKFHMGSAADAEYAEQFVPGIVYAVRFKGQEKIKGNKSVNKFQVFEVIAPPAASEPEKKAASGDKR